MKSQNLTVWIIIAVIVCMLWNYAALSRAGGLAVFVGMIAYFFCLYVITTIRNVNPWFVVFGILNIIGLVVILLAHKENWEVKSKN